MKDYFDKAKPDYFIIYKAQFDENVLNGKFSQIVNQKEVYQEWIDKTEKSSSDMTAAYYEIQKKMKSILEVKEGNDDVEDKINEVVQMCMKIDLPLPPQLMGPMKSPFKKELFESKEVNHQVAVEFET